MNKQIDKILASSKQVAIIGHINPDGDCFGSICGLHDYICSKFNCQIDCFADCNKVASEFEEFLDGLNFNPTPKPSYDMCICVDTTDLTRLGKYESVFNSSTKTACIDHHPTNTSFAQINILELRSSNCENIFYILKANKHSFKKSTLAKLYTGILTDTNNLTTNSVTSATYSCVAEIIQAGVDTYRIRQYFFGGNSLAQFKLLHTAMSSAKFYNNNTIMIMSLTQKDLKNCGATAEDLNPIINQAFCMKQAICAVLITPRNNQFHLSFRARGDIDVSVIATKFGGGGHKPASACSVEKVTKTMLNDIINNFTKQINSTPKNNKKLFE